MMLNQIALFKPDESLPLRRRVELQLCDLRDVRGILEHRHYLGRTRTGRQLNYLVLIDGIVDGAITYAYPFTMTPIANIPIDEVLEFARLWLRSNIPNSASCAIGKSLRRIKNDWMTSYPDSKEPRLVVSWSDTTRHKGTIYKAANFRLDGSAKVRPRRHLGSVADWATRKQNADAYHIKERWVYWL